ncbi:hypothetical protein OFM04_34810, partial [Escherichia coli]|nr:hypothetical protein [Escherichia coli]
GSVDLAALRKAGSRFGYKLKAAEHDEISLPEKQAYETSKRRFIIAAILSFPVLVIAMSHGRIQALDFPGVEWIQLILTTPVVF